MMHRTSQGHVHFLGEPADTAPIEDDGRPRLMPEYCGSEAILFVDDNAMFREMATFALRAYGYTVISACDGEDALAEAGRYLAPIHLVVTDVVMPNLDGRDLVKTLRNWYPKIRVLFMSGYSRGEAGVRDQSDAATGFIAKPFHVNQLAAAMRSLLNSRISGEHRAVKLDEPEITST
jgi:DNA-binding response OmpR family regulator